MKYWVSIGEKEFPVDLNESDGRTVAVIDGHEVELSIEEGGPGIYTLLVNGQPWDLAAAPRPRGFGIVLRGVPFDAQVENERQHRLSSADALKPMAEGRITLRAPMPGLVVQVDVDESDQVERGQRLVVLEAMKMENDIKAPRAGRVEKVLVKKGETAEQGQLLLVLE
jgi:biotin carboxyl carrier protein